MRPWPWPCGHGLGIGLGLDGAGLVNILIDGDDTIGTLHVL